MFTPALVGYARWTSGPAVPIPRLMQLVNDTLTTSALTQEALTTGALTEEAIAP
jgi:hypothetical protein